MPRQRIWLATLIAVAATSAAQAQITIEQAEEISQRTGRPILAVAGSKT